MCSVINLRSLNALVCHRHFKMEGINLFRDTLLQGDFMVKINLKDAYLTVPIAAPFPRPFSVQMAERIVEVQIQYLPYSLSSAL